MDAYKTTFITTKKIADDTLTTRLEKPSEFSFTPGQHIGVKLLDPPYTDDDGVIRTLSIASAPDTDYLEIATRDTQSAFKQSLKNMETGAPIEIDGPYGSMTLHKDTEKPGVFLAGGIGITPFASMIQDVIENKKEHILTLFFSNRAKETTPYLDKLRKYAATNSTFSFIPTMTRPNKSWSGETGHISASLLKKHIDSLKQSVYYIAGSTSFVKTMEEILEGLEVPELHIKAEMFSGYEK